MSSLLFQTKYNVNLLCRAEQAVIEMDAMTKTDDGSSSWTKPRLAPSVTRIQQVPGRAAVTDVDEDKGDESALNLDAVRTTKNTTGKISLAQYTVYDLRVLWITHMLLAYSK